MGLTQLFVRRPTLVFVMVTLVSMAGIISYLTIIQQQFPNIEFPTISVRASYSGASPSEIRDAVVIPIEDEIAGAANLDHINTTIQQGQAQISAVFTLSSNQTADLVEVQDRVQAAQSVLPTDLTAPSVSSFDPGEPTVATLSVYSKTLDPAALSALVTNNILPAIEQVNGVSTATASGAVTPAIEVLTDPGKLSADGFAIGDLVNTISQNNVRSPGGLAYSGNRETSIDVRGDVQTPDSIANLLLNGQAQNESNVGLGGSALVTGPSGGVSPNQASSSTSVSRGATAAGTVSAQSAAPTANVATSGNAQTATSATTVSAAGTAVAASAGMNTTNSASGTAGTTSSGNTAVTQVSPSSSPATGSTSAPSSAGSTGAAGSSASQTATAAAPATSAPATSVSNPTTAGSSGLSVTSASGVTGTSGAGGSSASGSSGAASTSVATSTIAAPAFTGTSAATPAPVASAAIASATPPPVGSNGGSSASSASASSTTTASTSASASTSSVATNGGFTPPMTTAAYDQSLVATQNPWSVSAQNVKIGDLATITDSYEPQRVQSYVNGRHIISINVQKATGASEITASQNVLAALPALRKQFPDVTFDILNVQATYTQQQLNGVFITLGEAIVFTGIVMLFFLRSWRNAIVVLIAIPTSLFATLTVMRLAGFTVDTVSLLAMTLLIGILVDDSIVVLENTERHYRDGEAPQTAAILGRSEIGVAAIVITLVDVVVFLPIAFLPGTVGRFLSEFGLVVTVATLTSLFTSFTVTPGLAGNWSLKSRWKPPFFINWFTRGFELLRDFYVTRFLEWGLRHAWIVFAISAVSTVAALALIPLNVIGFVFIPAVDRGEVFVQAKFPTGSPLTKTDAGIHKLAQQIARLPDVQSNTALAGAYQAGFGGSINLGNEGQIHVFLKPDAKHTTDQMVMILRRMGQKAMPDAQIVAIPATGTGGGNAQPLDYTVSVSNGSSDQYVSAVEKAMRETPGALNVTSSDENGAPQVDIEFDRDRARALDVSIGAAANAVKAAFGGALATQFDTTRGTKYVQVMYPRSAQTSLAAVRAISVRANNGSLVRVGDFATLKNDPQPPLMTRTNRVTVVHVSGNLATGATQSIVQNAFMARVRALHLPSSVVVRPNAGGQQQNLADTTRGMGSALLLSFLLVYLLMVALYNSYRLPFIIMFSVPVATVGALGALAITGQSLSLFALIGTVLLVGLVSKNGILLVDFAHRNMELGADRFTAIRAAARERFRPIIMTTSSMVAGMLPIALATDPGSEVRRALGIVVIGGLSSSLLLTLVLVPAVFVRMAPEIRPRKPYRPAPPRQLVPAEGVGAAR